MTQKEQTQIREAFRKRIFEFIKTYTLGVENWNSLSDAFEKEEDYLIKTIEERENKGLLLSDKIGLMVLETLKKTDKVEIYKEGDEIFVLDPDSLVLKKGDTE